MIQVKTGNHGKRNSKDEDNKGDHWRRQGIMVMSVEKGEDRKGGLGEKVYKMVRRGER
jgi:hypothetical protein